MLQLWPRGAKSLFHCLRRASSQDLRTASVVRGLPDRKGSRRDSAGHHVPRDGNRLLKRSGVEGTLVIEFCLANPHLRG